MSVFYRTANTPFHRNIPKKRMNTRAKCTACKTYFPQEEAVWANGLQRICSSECLSDHMDRRRPSKSAVKAKRSLKKSVRVRANPGTPVELRALVRARDRHVCRWCGSAGQEVHHVIYRSQGGPDEETNLILLCLGCHGRAHSSKTAFRPLLLACLWLHYAEDTYLTIPQVVRRLRAEGLLTELQEQRLSGN